MATPLRSAASWVLVILLISSMEIRYSLTETSVTDHYQSTPTTPTTTGNDNAATTDWSVPMTQEENDVTITTSGVGPGHSSTGHVQTTDDTGVSSRNPTLSDDTTVSALTSDSTNGITETSSTINGVDAITESLLRTSSLADFTSIANDVNGSDVDTNLSKGVTVSMTTSNSLIGTTESVTITESFEAVTDFVPISNGAEENDEVTHSTMDIVTKIIYDDDHHRVLSTVEHVEGIEASMSTDSHTGEQQGIATKGMDDDFTSTSRWMAGEGATVSPESHSGDSDFIWLTPTWTWDVILELTLGIFGILGNFLVIVIIFSRRSSVRSTDMLIGNLAIADFLTSMAIIPYGKPSSIPNTWQGMAWCLVFYQNVPFWWPVLASSYILMAISVERYIAVVYPMHLSSIVTVRRVRILVALIWFFALVSFLFGWFVTGVDDNYGCTLTLTNETGLVALGYYWFTIRIIVPVVTMLITQSMIAFELHRQWRNLRDVSTNNSFHLRARNRVLIIMLEIIVIYIVCWLPNQFAFLCAFVGYIEWGSYIGTQLHRGLTVLGFFNSCLNPLVYAAQNPKFRAAIKDLFKGETKKNYPVFSDHGADSSDKRRSRSNDTASSV